MGRVVGIDLGTTNSAVAFVGDDGQPEIIPDETDHTGLALRVIPSFVAVRPDGGSYVGGPARRESLNNPSSVVFGVKRLMGRAYDAAEVRTMAESIPYEIVPGTGQEAMVRVGNVTMSPSDVAAEILTYLRQRASAYLEAPVTDAVITVPAHFNDRQRKATKLAGERAGLTVLRLINEPTAAALAFGQGRNLDARFAVYDLGGGTFDISILEVADGIYEVLATGGDTFLGGNDFDNRLVGHLVRNFIIGKTTTALDPISMTRLKSAAEVAKIELSYRDSAEVVLNSFLGFDSFKAEIARPAFEEMTRDLVAQTMKVCGQTLNDAKIKPTDLDGVILVGGQTRMPLIRDIVKAFFGIEPNTDINPDEAVAIGAALHADTLTAGETASDVLLLDVTPLTLGIASVGDSFSPILERNTKVPCSITRTFSTVKDNQSSVKIVVLQGESNRSSQNVMLGSFVLDGIEPAPRLVPKIDVTFRLDANGILHVSAMDVQTGESKEVLIRGFAEGGEPAGAAATDVELKEQAPASRT